MSLALKEITWIRHGCTHMNEYLGRNRPFGPKFTDVFTSSDRYFYHDTKLSAYGIRQARERLARVKPSFCDDVQVVVTSPLTRALQTYDLGLRKHIDPNVPVLAHPAAAERLYFVSDLGTPASELRVKYDWCNFEHCSETWWWQHSSHLKEPYREWRPNSQGQKYACLGEPSHAFDQRMGRLYKFLERLPQQRIAVVCHHGVIEWMVDKDFDNCQYESLSWDDIQPHQLNSSSE